jgi:hypothetical protein
MFSTRYVKDGSYLSVKNITLGYTLDEKNEHKYHLRLYISIENALLFTKYPGPNPEVSLAPQSSGIAEGIDRNSFPITRTVTFGVNFGF